MSPKQYPIGGHDIPRWMSGLLDGSDCEFLSEYEGEGLCPILIDDVLNGRNLLREEDQCAFKILGKLGRGSYSTVWLGKNTNTAEYLALKALRKEHSTPDNTEMRILQKLGKLKAAFFYTYAPTQSQFLCLGLKPMGSSLRDLWEASIYLPRNPASMTTLVKILVARVLDIHAQGICHGDISHSNVVLATHRDAFKPESLQETFESDRKSKVRLLGRQDISGTLPSRPICLPEYIVARDGPPLLTDTDDMSLVDIIDFGSAFEGVSKKNVLGTEQYCAPELERDTTNIATQKSDLWSLGCVIAYALAADHLLYGDGKENYIAGNDEQQLEIIRKHLRISERLEVESEFWHSMARLIHSLVRVDPEARNVEEMKRILKQLEEYQISKQLDQ